MSKGIKGSRPVPKVWARHYVPSQYLSKSSQEQLTLRHRRAWKECKLSRNMGAMINLSSYSSGDEISTINISTFPRCRQCHEDREHPPRHTGVIIRLQRSILPSDFWNVCTAMLARDSSPVFVILGAGLNCHGSHVMWRRHRQPFFVHNDGNISRVFVNSSFCIFILPTLNVIQFVRRACLGVE